MKFLSIAGTIAMFLVGGGIIAHGIPVLHHGQEWLEHLVGGGWPGTLLGVLYTGVIGIILGALLVAVFEGIQKLRGKSAADAAH